MLSSEMRVRRVQGEHQNEHDDEDDVRGSFSCRPVGSVTFDENSVPPWTRGDFRGVLGKEKPTALNGLQIAECLLGQS